MTIDTHSRNLQEGSARIHRVGVSSYAQVLFRVSRCLPARAKFDVL
jgi:hypothetical protein